jgi:hypothetical protein
MSGHFYCVGIGMKNSFIFVPYVKNTSFWKHLLKSKGHFNVRWNMYEEWVLKWQVL